MFYHRVSFRLKSAFKIASVILTITCVILLSFYFYNSKNQATSGLAAATVLNTNFSTSTYLGGVLDSDNSGGISIQPDKTIVWAGRISGNNFGKVPTNLDGGGNGVVLRLDQTGSSLISISRIGDYVEDLAVNRTNGNIIAHTDKGIYVLDSMASNVLWSNNFGASAIGQQVNGRRIAIANDGKIVASNNRTIKIFEENGTVIGSFDESGGRIQDIAIDSTNQTVFIGGDTQKDGGSCSQLRMAYIHAYSYTGVLKWRGYDWTHAEAAAASNSCPDTAIKRLKIGEDGMLYFAGISAGGGSIFRYKPRDISATAPNVEFDQFNTPYNINGAANITYYARLNPIDGSILKGQHILARLDTSKGNTVNPLSITADVNGRVYLMVSSAYKFANREATTSNNVPPGTYNGDEVLLQVSPDFGSREQISILNNSGSSNYTTSETREGSEVAVDFGVVAYGGKMTQAIHTFNALQPTKNSGVDNYLAVVASVPSNQSGNTILTLKSNLAGAYQQANNTMTDKLSLNQLVPLTQPYSSAPYNYTGSETVTQDDLANNNVADWVLVEVNNANNVNIKKQAALLTKNGNILDSTSKLIGLNLGTNFVSGSYNVVIRHRNHLAISTSTPITITNGIQGTITKDANNNTLISAANAFDFNNNANVKNGNQQSLGTNMYGLKAGDVNSDGNVDATDRNFVRSASEKFNTYNNLDLNLDGSIDATDRAYIRATPESAAGF